MVNSISTKGHTRRRQRTAETTPHSKRRPGVVFPLTVESGVPYSPISPQQEASLEGKTQLSIHTHSHKQPPTTAPTKGREKMHWPRGGVLLSAPCAEIEKLWKFHHTPYCIPLRTFFHVSNQKTYTCIYLGSIFICSSVVPFGRHSLS